jgi:hypothetical protein
MVQFVTVEHCWIARRIEAESAPKFCHYAIAMPPRRNAPRHLLSDRFANDRLFIYTAQNYSVAGNDYHYTYYLAFGRHWRAPGARRSGVEQLGEYARRMVAGIDLIIDACDSPLLVD